MADTAGMGNPRLSNVSIEYRPQPLLPSAREQRAARLAAAHVVIVCGGRDYVDADRVFAALDLAHGRRAITLLVHGACLDQKRGKLLGTDRWADEWGTEHGVQIECHPAAWECWGKAAEPMRNKQMAEAGAHGCIAFPGGSGTENMVRHATRFGIPVWRPFGASL